jgi:hypothetical protein
MKQLFTLLILLFASVVTCNAQIFWTENFESGSPTGLIASSYTGPNGPWAIAVTGIEDPEFNQWYVSCAEAGHLAGVCGTTCATSLGLGATLHVGANAGIIGDNGASYDAGGLFTATTTDRRAVSPTIICTGKYSITLKFYYIMDGQAGIDYATVWYSPDNGVSWSILSTPPPTPTLCPSQGYWTHYSVALPVSANNNATVKLAFGWINNNDAVGTDPSFAVDSVNLSTSGVTTPVPSFSVTPSYAVCQDSCISFTNTSVGTIDSFRWTGSGITFTTATTSPAVACFSVAGTYTATLTVYRGGTPYIATHTLTVNPSPHPLIHYLPGHTLSVTGAYTGYQWLTGSPVPAIIPGATNINGVNGQYNTFWCTQESNTARVTLRAGQVVEDDIQITIYEATGRQVAKDTWTKYTYTKEINGADLPVGLYIIKLNNQNTASVFKWLR